MSGALFCAIAGTIKVAASSMYFMFGLLARVLLRASGVRRRLENEFLNSPGFDFTCHDFIRIAAIHHVDHLESWAQLAGVAELAEHRPIQLGFVNLAGDIPGPGLIPVRIGVRKERILMRPRGNAHRPAYAEV